MTTRHEDAVLALAAALDEAERDADAAHLRAERYRQALDLIKPSIDLDEQKPALNADHPDGCICVTCENHRRQGARPPRTLPATKKAAGGTPKARDHECPNCHKKFSGVGIARHTAACSAADAAFTPPPEPDLELPAADPLPGVLLAAVPDPPAAPTPPADRNTGADDLPNRRPAPAAQIPGRHFECDTCDNDDADFATIRELTHHTITAHKRPLRPSERIAQPNRAS